MKLYERIENNNFDEIDKNRAIELIECGNGHLIYNENYFKLQKENEKLKNIELKSKGGAIKISLEGILSLENKIKQLEKENFDLKDRLSWRIIYCQELEKDLFENCENFVISKDRVKEQIKKYAKLSDNFYSKWKKLSPFNEDYKNLKDKCMCCDTIVDVLQKLLKG